MDHISLKIEENFMDAITTVMKKHNYMTKTEFIREAIRDKIRILEEKDGSAGKGRPIKTKGSSS